MLDPSRAYLARGRDGQLRIVASVTENLRTPELIRAYFRDEALFANGNVVVPYSVHNVRALGRMGARADVPIMRNAYDFPFVIPGEGHKEPFDHQITTSDFLVMHPRAFCLNGMGTGKTLSALWAMDFMMRQKLIDRVLIICTASTVKEVWDLQYHYITPAPDVAMLVGDRARRLEQMRRKSQVDIINHDGLRHYEDEMVKRKYDLIIIDEATRFKTPDTGRSRVARKLAHACPRLWQLSGSIIPNAPIEAWHPAHMAYPGEHVGYELFKRNVMRPIKLGKKKPGKKRKIKMVAQAGGEAAAYRILHPAIRYKKSDCIDLPPVIIEERSIPLSTEQKKTLASLKQKKLVEVHKSDGSISFDRAKTYADKVIQITSGVYYESVSGQRQQLNMTPKLQVTRDLIEEGEAKTLILTVYTEAVDYLMEELSDYKPARVDGTVPSGPRRDKEIGRFREDPDSRIMIAHPESAGHGLNLTMVDTTIWFTAASVGEWWMQANERMARPGQENKMMVYKFVSTPEERATFRVAEGRETLQEAFNSLY